MDTKKKIFINYKFWAIVLVAQFLLFYILSKINLAIIFFSKLFEWKKNGHIFLFSRFYFSVGDVIYTLVTIFLLYSIFGLIKRKKTSLKHIFILLNIFYFVYQSFWGMLYFQTPIIEKLAKKEVKDEDLKKLTLKYLQLCKETRERVSEDKNGVFRIKNILEIENEILLQQQVLPKEICQKDAVSPLSVKASFYSKFMNYTGILGYYNPFTAESQYNPNLPATQIPFTLAHEMSHQLGFAREQEASFIAYLCAKNSRNLDLQYSAQLYVLKSLLNALSSNNETFVKEILTQYSAKMKKDRMTERAFFENHEGVISDFFGITNDLFLKSNQQDGKISYSYLINLLVLYEL